MSRSWLRFGGTAEGTRLEGEIRITPPHRMSATSAAAPPAKRTRPAALEARVSTVALPSLGKIYAIAVAKDGTTFVATASALFIVTPTGHHALLAGSRTKAGYKDCQGDKARFDGRPASQWRRTAACWWPTATTTACATWWRFSARLWARSTCSSIALISISKRPRSSARLSPRCWRRRWEGMEKGQDAELS